MFTLNLNEKKYKHIHFIGIGGISMSALAELVDSYGYMVTGSDNKKSKLTSRLEEKGIKIYYGHSPENIKGCDLIVFTDAISMDNPELKAGIFEKKDIIDRASFLGALMKNYKISMAISGTHGKTTTTSMVASAIKSHESDPTILLGGNLGDIHGNVKIGKEEMFLTEACEYRANVLKYFPTTAVILNIDEDHLDYFDNLGHIMDTFKGYIDNLNPQDLLVLNIDDNNAREMEKYAKSRIVKVSIKEDADYQAKNISVDSKGQPSYDLYIKGQFIIRVDLHVMGLHNVSNSLAAIATCHENGIPIHDAVRGVQSYRGVQRRLEYKGTRDDIVIIDDYAHHPTEILSTLHAVKPIVSNRLICIFQPHTYTRTKLLLESFSKSFHEADLTIITDIYAAREKDYGDIHSKTLVEAISSQGDNAKYISTHEEVLEYLKDKTRPGDLVLTMGAGDVYTIGESFLED